MKNKESFLKELQNGLAVLAESEQQDILAEYAQHIDMRIAGGLTEEEAIQDFGDIHQLTAEILAAYHVNPAYSRAPGKLPDPRPALSRAWSHTGNFFRRLGHGLAVFFSRAGRAIAAFPHRLAARFRILFRRPNVMQQESEECIVQITEESRPLSSRKQRAGTAFGGFLHSAGNGIVRLCRFLAWLLWNFALALCALPFLGAGLAALLLFGVLMVWLVQGLPLTGAVLGCVGITAFCAGVLGLGSGLIWHRHRPASAQADTVPPQVLSTMREELEKEENPDEK